MSSATASASANYQQNSQSNNSIYEEKERAARAALERAIKTEKKSSTIGQSNNSIYEEKERAAKAALERAIKTEKKSSTIGQFFNRNKERSGPAKTEKFQKAGDAYNAGDYATALRELRPLADRGNADAQLNLGHMYRDGDGVRRNEFEAVAWYRLAADQDNNTRAKSIAQFSLGSMYHNGNLYYRSSDPNAILQNFSLASLWYELAVRNGLSEAKINQGVMYYNGESVPKDRVRACKLWKSAANQGNDLAKTMVSKNC